MSGRRCHGETDPLLIPPSAVASTGYRVFVLGSGDSDTVVVQLEILVPEALGRVDEESYVWYGDMGKANGNGKIYFHCKDLEQSADVNQTQRTDRRGRLCKRTV
jgi:hypothetical protein